MNKQKKRKNCRMVQLPITGEWVSEKLAMQFKSLDIMEGIEGHKDGMKLYKCVLDGKTVTTDTRHSKAVYILLNENRPMYVGSTNRKDGDIMSRPMSHRKPGKYSKSYDEFTVIALPDDACHLMAEMSLIERLRRKYNLRNDGYSPPMRYNEWSGLVKLWKSYCRRRNTHTEPFGLNKEIINFKGI